jgi:tyrosine-protein phosphatase YwqE
MRQGKVIKLKNNEEKESILKKFKDMIMRKKLPQCEKIINQVYDLIYETRVRNMQSLIAHSERCNEQQRKEMLQLLEKKAEARVNEIKRLKREVNDIVKLAQKLENMS